MSGIEITEDTLTPRLKSLHPQLHGAIMATMTFFADRAEKYAKSNAPWQDQTGNARQALSARAIGAPTRYVIVVFHQMPYGVWLEVRWSGRYAIILPTIEHIGPQLMTALSRVLGDLR